MHLSQHRHHPDYELLGFLTKEANLCVNVAVDLHGESCREILGKLFSKIGVFSVYARIIILYSLA